MAYYNYQTEGKTATNFKEKAEQRLEGTVELAPNVNYNLEDVYKFKGLGKVFDVTYKIKKLTKKINLSGMTVSAEVTELVKYIAPPPVPVEKAPVKTKGDKYITVKRGDTLSQLSLTHTGKVNNWKAIEEANRKLIVGRDARNKFDRGHWIYPNQRILIPGYLLK